jgi:predicted TIM-barrel fold metal-dependent hydrolase
LIIQNVDREFYQERLANFLPSQLIDIHAHIWLRDFEIADGPAERGAQWAGKVAAENTSESLIQEYRQMLPMQQVTPLVFGLPSRRIDVAANNRWVHEQAHKYDFPSLLVSTPEMTPSELENQVKQGGFRGLKPYLDFAPLHLPSDSITIFDFLPHTHLEVADANNWIVMLHIPRSKRLKDPINLMQMLEIEHSYPRLKLVIAHIGRAYCLADLGNAMQELHKSEKLFFDFSANTNVEVMDALIKCVGSQRILFGSDMPITHMRMRRICEDGSYINLVPPGIYGDISDDPHMRAVSPEEGKRLSFFLYEQLFAFRIAAEMNNLASSDVEDIFYRNAMRLLETSEG